MKTFNNEIVVHRNEVFTIDKIIQNKDGSPYVISKELSNPYFLLTVSTTRYSQKDRYVKNYWLNLLNFPRFNSTQCIDLHSIKTSSAGTDIKYNDFSDVVPTSDYLLSGYISGQYVEFDADDAVFFVNNNGIKTYKYYNVSSNKWLVYNCRLIKQFSNDDTKDWVEQSYVYSITLVSGELATDGDMPIKEFDTVSTILAPTKMSVLSNVLGGF